MASEFRLPDIGEGLTDAEIVAWNVRVGDPIAEGDPLCEVETAKAVVELTSPWSGFLLHLGAAEGDTIEVGAVLVVIGAEGEKWQDDVAAASSVSPSTEEPASTRLQSRTTSPSETSVKAMPVVRRLADDLGVDLGTISPTDPAGRISRADVLAAAQTEESRQPAPPTTDERIALSKMRRTISHRMAESWAQIPHVTTFDDVNVTELLSFRSALASQIEPVSLEALLIAAVLPSLREFAEFNATIDGDDLILHRTYDIGVAVDTAAGLTVPVVHDAASLDPYQLTRAIDDLSKRARNRSLAASELTGGTFTVSNIGALGGGHGTPIIPPGTTAIISFGRALDRPAVVDGVLAVAPVMPISLSYDHRIIDGGLGRRFVDSVVGRISEPGRIPSA